MSATLYRGRRLSPEVANGVEPWTNPTILGVNQAAFFRGVSRTPEESWRCMDEAGRKRIRHIKLIVRRFAAAMAVLIIAVGISLLSLAIASV